MKKSLSINPQAMGMVLAILAAFLVTGCGGGDSGGGGATQNGPLVSATISANTIVLGGSITGNVTSNADMVNVFMSFYPLNAQSTFNVGYSTATSDTNTVRNITVTIMENDGIKGATDPGVQVEMADGFMWSYFLQNPTDTKFSARKWDASINLLEGPFATDIPALVLVVQ